MKKYWVTYWICDDDYSYSVNALNEDDAIMYIKQGKGEGQFGQIPSRLSRKFTAKLY